jgi:hypothetical protein
MHVQKANANSTRVADDLSARYPSLHFVIQTAESHSSIAKPSKDNVTVKTRMPGSAQTIEDAAVYILQLPHSSQALLRSDGQQALDSHLQAELRAHIGVLRSNPSTTLILTPRLLPEPGALDPDVEAHARLRDISRLQLRDERDWDLNEFMNALNKIQDNTGRLIVVNQLSLPRTTMMALGVKYQSHTDGPRESGQGLKI